MSSGHLWVGLDVGAKRSSLCALDDSGAVCLKRDCETRAEEVERALASLTDCSVKTIALEASAPAVHLARELARLGYPISLLEARQASKYLTIRRNKTDVGDAQGLAEIARMGGTVIRTVHLKTTETQILRSKLVLRHKLVRETVAVQNVIRAIFGMYGGKPGPMHSTSRLEQSIGAEIKRIRQDCAVDLSDLVYPAFAAEIKLRELVKKFDGEIAAACKAIPACKRMTTVPGVGPICAVSFFTAVEAFDRFGDSSSIGAFFGLVPRTLQSGEKLRQVGITKMGSRLTRTHLVNAAAVLMHVSKADCALKRWGLELASRRGTQKARVGVARKLAVLLLTLWRKDADFEPFPTHPHAIG